VKEIKERKCGKCKEEEYIQPKKKRNGTESNYEGRERKRYDSKKNERM
jgi:hypothetical protein